MAAPSGEVNENAEQDASKLSTPAAAAAGAGATGSKHESQSSGNSGTNTGSNHTQTNSNSQQTLDHEPVPLSDDEEEDERVVSPRSQKVAVIMDNDSSKDVRSFDQALRNSKLVDKEINNTLERSRHSSPKKKSFVLFCLFFLFSFVISFRLFFFFPIILLVFFLIFVQT